MPKLQESNNRYFITVPKDLVERKQWTKGQAIYFIFNERGNIELMS